MVYSVPVKEYAYLQRVSAPSSLQLSDHGVPGLFHGDWSWRFGGYKKTSRRAVWPVREVGNNVGNFEQRRTAMANNEERDDRFTGIETFEGYEVHDRDSDKIGKVDDLFVDP